MRTLLSAKNLYHIYQSRKKHTSVVALKGVSLDIDKGEYITVVGPSGSGKTTFLRILGGLMRPTAGTVLFDNQDITKMPEEDLTMFRRNDVGFVFQEGNLQPDLSAFKNVANSLALNGIPYQFRKKRTMKLLKTMGVAHRKDQLAVRLSGGERQRVALARAMANNPKLIIADEPTGNVDYKTSVRLLELFRQLNKTVGMTFLFATHSNHVAGYADRSVELRDGLFLGQHGQNIDLAKLDMTRMVIMDSNNRITIPESIMEQIKNNLEFLWNIEVLEKNKILLSPIEDWSKEEIEKEEGVEIIECPICHIENSSKAKFCIKCGTKF